MTFQPTPPIPPYLLAFCSGRLKGKVRKTESGMDVGVWAPPSLEEVGEVDVTLDVSDNQIMPFASMRLICSTLSRTTSDGLHFHEAVSEGHQQYGDGRVTAICCHVR